MKTPEASLLPAPIDRAELQHCLAELPPLPQAALDAMAALRDETLGGQRCAELIGHDQALAARTLRLANSAFYGVPGRVVSLADAVQLLGRRTLGSLLSVALLARQFDARHCPPLSFSAFWRHAMAAALASRSLAAALNVDQDQAFIGGLLHDVGRLALAARFPAQTSAALQHAQERDSGLPEAERAILGTDHVEVGVQVARHWRFPAVVVQAIAEHHAPRPAAGGGPSLGDIVHAADALAHALDLAGDEHEIVPALDAAAWERLALPQRVLLQTLADTERGVAELALALGV